MITAILAGLAGGTLVVGAIVVMVARAISPLGRGENLLDDSFTGPPEAVPAYAELQRLELQYSLAEELGSLDAGSLEDLRLAVVAARSRYESAMAQATVEVLSPQDQAAVEAAGADCLAPIPVVQPALGFVSPTVPVQVGRAGKR